ncbi:hypothetical protein TNCV_2188931 [Trichonephila clavipes]|nr:hypothetical protein TNCV_2188931 [Trichonephila clavipes]
MSFTRRSGSGHPQQTRRREDSHIGPLCSRTIRRRLAEGHLEPRSPLRVLPLTPPFGVMPRTRKLDCSGMEPSRL